MINTSSDARCVYVRCADSAWRAAYRACPGVVHTANLSERAVQSACEAVAGCVSRLSKPRGPLYYLSATLTQKQRTYNNTTPPLALSLDSSASVKTKCMRANGTLLAVSTSHIPRTTYTLQHGDGLRVRRISRRMGYSCIACAGARLMCLMGVVNRRGAEALFCGRFRSRTCRPHPPSS